MNKRSLPNESGFTLIEVICAVVLIGIVTIHVGFANSNSQTDLIIQAELLKGRLRFSQIKAMGSDVQWGIRFNTVNNTYTLREGAADSASFFPNEQANTVDLAALGISVAVAGGPSIVTFSSYRGIPNAAYTITLTKNAQNQNIIITANTGFIS